MTTPTGLIAQRAAATPNRPVVRMDDGALTYRDLDLGSQGVARWLQDHGVAKAGRVATMFGNSPEAILVWLGIERSGAVEIPINTALSGRLLAEQLELSRPDMVIAEPAYEATIAAALQLAGSTAPIHVVESGIDDITAPGAPETDIAAQDTAMILFTSGTTGRSKGVALPHCSTMRLAQSIVGHVELGRDDVLFTAFPLFHIAARFVSVVAAALCDGEVVVERRFSASDFWEACRRQGVTAIHYLGTLPMMLLNQPARPTDAEHTVRVAYGAGMPPSVVQEFEARFSLTTRELYGSTEQGLVAINRKGATRAGSCGLPVDDVELEIHNDQDYQVPAGAWGEIVVRPRYPNLFFSGYDGMPEATLESWRNLWFHTGDLGRVDADGFLYFGGRIKEAIRRRGENISAWEVERAVGGFAGVADVAAVGVPSPLGDEEVLAVVVGIEPIEWEAMNRHCANELPSYAVPRYFRQVAELPRTATGRVQKYKLATEGITTDTWDRTIAEGASST